MDDERKNLYEDNDEPEKKKDLYEEYKESENLKTNDEVSESNNDDVVDEIIKEFKDDTVEESEKEQSDDEEEDFDDYFGMDADYEELEDDSPRKPKTTECYSASSNSNMGAVLGVILIVVCLCIFVFALPSNRDVTELPVPSPSVDTISQDVVIPKAQDSHARRDHNGVNDRDGSKLNDDLNSIIPSNDDVLVPSVPTQANKELSANEIYNKTVSSVVEIQANVIVNYGGMGKTVSDVTHYGYFNDVETTVFSAGFIISEDGYIFTNAHVVENAYNITATLYNGDIYEAKLVGINRIHDVAILKIDAENLNPVRIGSSSDLTIGDSVYAIGHPLDLKYSMSSGIVSAPERIIVDNEGNSLPLIQIDCAINDGNSGGPLLNSRGEVIGITNAKYAGSNIERIGFAVPIDFAVNDYILALHYNETYPQSYLGVTYVTIDEATAATFYFVPGAFIHDVVRGSAAEKAGLMVGDIIVGVNGTYIYDGFLLADIVSDFYPGETVSFIVYRNGMEMIIDVVLDARVVEIQDLYDPYIEAEILNSQN